MLEKQYRGSRRHILDRFERADFARSLTRMIEPSGGVVTGDDG